MTADIQIEDYSDALLRITLTDDNTSVQVLDIKKENITTGVSDDYVLVYYHKYGIERGADFVALDYNLVSNMTVASAEELQIRIEELRGRTRSFSKEHFRHFLYMGA